MRALERRLRGAARNVLEHGRLRLDPVSLRVTHDGEPVALQRREFMLLHKLLAAPGQVLTRSQLEEALYGWDGNVESNALDVHVHNLRRKLYPGVIRTVRGVGYVADPPAKPRSTRALLLGGSIAVLLAVLGAAAWLGYDGSADEADELRRAPRHLRASARRPRRHSATERRARAAGVPARAARGSAARRGRTAGHYYETKIAFQLIDSGGRVLMRSASAPEAAYAPLEPGFSTQRHGGRDWRVFSLRSGEHWVQAERDDVRGELSAACARRRRAGDRRHPTRRPPARAASRIRARAAAELARRIARRQPDSLAPIELARSTAEIAPVVQALNGSARVQSAIARERRFTADAAHELRTPLAALKIHAQNAARAVSDAERRASLERMLAGLARDLPGRADARAQPGDGGRAGPRTGTAARGGRRCARRCAPGAEGARREAEPGGGPAGRRLHGARRPRQARLSGAQPRGQRGALLAGRLERARGARQRGGRDAPRGVRRGPRDCARAARTRVRELLPHSRAPGDGSGLGLAIVREIARSTMRAWKSTRATAVAARASTSCSVLDNAPVDQLDHAVALSGEGVVVRHE